MNIRKMFVVFLGTSFIFAGLSGCGSTTRETASPQTHESDDDQQTLKEAQAVSLSKLSDEDRKLAEVQGYCAVTEEPLGSMGTPIKLTVKDQPVFICCKGCQRKALANADITLANMEKMRSKVKLESDQ